MNVASMKGHIDYGIVTIKPDELAAVLDEFPHSEDINGGRQPYRTATVESGGALRRVAIVRQLEQGNVAAYEATRTMIEELDPRWLFLVGIAGSAPSPEYTLGDVVLASRLLDYSVSAAIQDRDPEFDVRGGAVHPDVKYLLQRFPAPLGDVLQSWHAPLTKPMLEAPPDTDDPRLYGSDSFKKKVMLALKTHFAGPTVQPPRVQVGTVASSNTLVKSSSLLEEWQQSGRSIDAIEMELAGAYQAATAGAPPRPLLAIRGISDVVGFKRDAAWTLFACRVAARFCRALIDSALIEKGQMHHQRLDRLVLMDAASKSAVYDDVDFHYGRTNADVLTDILKAPTRILMRELASPMWSREDELVKFDPDLVVIHMSCFDGGARSADAYRRLTNFLTRLYDAPHTRFLVYTRAPDADDNEETCRRWEAQRALLSEPRWQQRVRLHVIPPERGTFHHPETANEIRAAVRELTDD